MLGGYCDSDRRSGYQRGTWFRFKETTLSSAGRAKSVKVQKENTIIVDGEGDKAAIDARISQIKKQIEETTSDFDKEKFRKDLQNLQRRSSYPCWRSYKKQK